MNRLALVKTISSPQDVTSLDVYKDEILTINANNSVSFIPINDDVSLLPLNIYPCFSLFFYHSSRPIHPNLKHLLSSRKSVRLVLYQLINYFCLVAQKARYFCMLKSINESISSVSELDHSLIES